MPYAIENVKEGKCLNNFNTYSGRIINANFVDVKQQPNVVRFSNEEDAQSLADRISKFLKCKIKTIAL
jgi:hypothetical protein